ncbi:MAG TPA: hypothetical protein VFM70_04480 [Salinimicrobium sp.]|nr:hypothetical protein [Salinimicrobium sp.]
MKKLLLIFALIAFLSCSDNGKKEFTPLDALVMSQHFVKQKLKSPSTAEFGSSTERVTKLNDSTFMVRNYVDSQNSFGAMIRSEYACTLYFTNDATAYLIDLTIE